MEFAKTLSPREIETIKELFGTADIAKKGSLSRRELQRVFAALHLDVTPQGFESLFLALDKDKVIDARWRAALQLLDQVWTSQNGVITLDEFMGGFRMLQHPAAVAAPAHEQPSAFAGFLQNYDQHTGTELFQLCDLDHDGSISRDELRTVLTTHAHIAVRASDFDALWARLDANGDGRISLAEFLAAMQWEAARESNRHAPPQQQLAALRVFTASLVNNVIQTAQRAADKGMVKTAHACVEVIDVAAAQAVGAISAEQCDAIAAIKAMQ